VSAPPDGAPSWVPLAFIVVTAAATALGGLALTTRRRWDDMLLQYFVALGAGFMLAAATLQMIPISAEMTRFAPGLVLAGYLLIHFVEHTVVHHFHFGKETHTEHAHGRMAIPAVIGLSVHSFFDGISIASGFFVSPSLGFLLFAAIVLHKAPEGFTIASIMLAAGRSRGVAQLSSVIVGAASVAGALCVYPLRRFVGEGLALSAGVTLYVAASDLIPEVNRSEARAIAIVVFAGVLLYYVTERMLHALGV
jgi:ZIP family zinc transporter/zinc and cadmium transporter